MVILHVMSCISRREGEREGNIGGCNLTQFADSTTRQILRSPILNCSVMELLQDIRELQQEDEGVGPVLEAVEAAKSPAQTTSQGEGQKEATFCRCVTSL